MSADKSPKSWDRIWPGPAETGLAFDTDFGEWIEIIWKLLANLKIYKIKSMYCSVIQVIEKLYNLIPM